MLFKVPRISRLLFSPFSRGAPAEIPALWRARIEDVRPLLLIALLPVIVALPQLLGWLHADPMLYVGSMTLHPVHGFLPGVPYIDPNNGFTTQALGYRAALDWIQGVVPWWNPYSGVGLPLAAEYQPAAFFPLTLLLLLPNGVVWRHLLLQLLAGWGTYGLLRQLKLQRTGATTGGILYAFSGTLAWFDFAAAYTVPFLPWMLWGIERARVKSELHLAGGWRMFAIAMAMNLLAGFPETAYFNGLLALAWSVLCGVQTSRRLAYAGRIALGGIIGLVLSAPQVLAFAEFLPDAWVGIHTPRMGHISLPGAALLPSLIAPYALGPPFALSFPLSTLPHVFGNIGGYVTPPLLLLAIYAAATRPGARTWLLLVWTVTTIGKTFGLEPFVWIWNLVPGISESAFHRYAQQTWEFSLIVLAAMAIDRIGEKCRLHGPAVVAVLALVFVAIAGAATFYGEFLLPNFASNVGLRYCATASAFWALMTTFACLAVLVCERTPWTPFAAAALLVVDSMLMYATPTLANPRGGAVDESAIAFLRSHLGLQRFYTLGPIQPNYGAYFGIASINHNYLPVAQLWTDWVREHLDSAANPDIFNGSTPRRPDQPLQAAELRRNLQAYEALGVKYVVSPVGSNPFVETISNRTDAGGRKPLLLAAGQSATGTLPATLIRSNTSVLGIGVLIGNNGNRANGVLEVTLCNAVECASGSRDLAPSRDGGVFDVALEKTIQVAANAPVRYTFTYRAGTVPMALWISPTTPDQTQNLVGPGGAVAGFGLQVLLALPSPLERAAKLVYSDEILTVYELPDPKPYFEAIGGPCVLEPSERTRLTAHCQAPATLVRRELFFPGWTAETNGESASIRQHDGLLQAVALPAGASTIRFRYAPPLAGWAWLAFFAALATLVGASASVRARLGGFWRVPGAAGEPDAPDADHKSSIQR